jgi:hypothetical protein
MEPGAAPRPFNPGRNAKETTMVDKEKLAKAGDALKGQSQQDEPRTPADLAIEGSERRDAPPAGGQAAPRPKPAA